MVCISCLVCDKPIELPQYIDTENYEGQVICQTCESLLHIKLIAAKVRKYRVIEKKFRTPSADEIASMYKAALQQLGDSNLGQSPPHTSR